MASEIKVDTVSEKTSGSGVTIDGLLIKDGGISGDVSLIGTTPTFTIGDAGAEDAALVFDGNAQDFYIALDDSADDLLIGKGSAVGTTPAVAIDENLQVKIVATTASTSATTGSFIAAGGAGVAADLHVGDDVTLISDSAVLGFGADKDTTLTHTDGTGLTLNSTNKLCFNDATQFIQGASGTVLNIAATDEIDLTATAVDLNGNLDVSGTTLLPTLGVVTAKDLGTGIHVRTADSGGSVQNYADELVLEGGAAGTGMTILCQNDQSGSIMFGDQDDNDVGFIQYSHGSEYMRFITNGVEHMRIDGIGAVTKPLQPAFHVTNAAQNNLGTDASATITFSTEVFDVNADFNTSNYTFTAPVTGKYTLTFHMTLNAMDSASPFTYAHLDTSNREYYSWYDNNTELSGDAGYVTFHISVLADMDANDTALGKVFIGGGTAQTDLATATNTWFTGFLAC